MYIYSQFPTFSLADAAVFVYNYTTRLKHKKVRVFVSTKMCSQQTQTIPGIGIEVLMFWPVLVLVLKIPVSQVLVLVLVLKN